MQIENLNRAAHLAGELKNLDMQIANAEKLVAADTGFLLCQYGDGSGIKVNYIYQNGRYAMDLYHDIAVFALERMREFRCALVAEIETL